MTRRAPLTFLVLAALMAAPGCLAATARVSAGPTLATDGDVGVQAMVSLGFGLGGRESAVTSRLGAQSSDRSAIAFAQQVDVTHINKKRVLSGGVGGEIVGTGDSYAAWFSGAVLRPLRYRDRVDPGHEKIGFGGTTRWALAAGLEGRVGLTGTRESGAASDTRGLFALMPTIDFTMTSTLRF